MANLLVGVQDSMSLLVRVLILPSLVLVVVHGYRHPWGSLTAGCEGMAVAWCKSYYEKAEYWKYIRLRYPRTLLEMEQPLDPEEDASPFVRVVQDPWGGVYWLEHVAESIRVRSAGSDGAWDTEDDVAYPPGDGE